MNHEAGERRAGPQVRRGGARIRLSEKRKRSDGIEGNNITMMIKIIITII